MTAPRPTSSGRIPRRIARLVSDLVYREIDIATDPRMTGGGPTIIVANHFGGLADAVLLVDALPSMPRIVARDVIWRIPIIGQLATALGGIAVHRRADGGRSSNDEMFADCYGALASGDTILIFPEGVTQDVPHIAPVRTGAARIALGARAAGTAGVRIVPVGVHYEDKAVFRSRVLVNVGPPLDLDDWADRRGGAEGADDRAAVRELTALIEARLRAAAPDFPDWDTALDYTTAALVPLHEVGDPSVPLRYGDTQLLAKRLQTVDADGAVAAEAGRYRAALAQTRTTDQAVVERRRGRWWQSQSAWRDLLLSVLLLPYALIGIVVGFLPWLLVQAVRLLPAAPAVRATITPGLTALAFGAEWALGAWSLLRSSGTDAAATWVLLFPLFIAATVFVAERMSLMLRRFAGLRRPMGPRLEEVRRLRAELSDLVWRRL